MKLSEILKNAARKASPEVKAVIRPALAAAKSALALAILQKLAEIAEKHVQPETTGTDTAITSESGTLPPQD